MTRQLNISFGAILILCFIIGGACGFFLGKRQEEAPLTNEERLRIAIRQDSLVNDTKVREEKLKVVQELADSLQKERSKVEVKTVYLESKRNEKIKIIDGYNGSELYQFFSSLQTPDSLSRQGHLSLF